MQNRAFDTKMETEEKGTIDKGIFNWNSTPPSWVIEGFVTNIIVECSSLMEVAHEGGTKKLSRARVVRSANIYAYSELNDLSLLLNSVKAATLTPKHAVLRKMLPSMVGALSMAGIAQEESGPDDEDAAISVASGLVVALTYLSTIMHDKTTSKERRELGDEYAKIHGVING